MKINLLELTLVGGVRKRERAFLQKMFDISFSSLEYPYFLSLSLSHFSLRRELTRNKNKKQKNMQQWFLLPFIFVCRFCGCRVEGSELEVDGWMNDKID
jgi:hypothetical protein